jgi:hypothetical protein
MNSDIMGPRNIVSPHAHKFYLFETKSAFEPVDGSVGEQYYIRAEYATLFCNCGEAIKTRIKPKDEV